MNLIGPVTGTLVDALNSLGAGGIGQAEDVAGRGIPPCLLERNALIALDVQVGLVCISERLAGNPHHAGVYVHELRHHEPPLPAVLHLR